MIKIVLLIAAKIAKPALLITGGLLAVGTLQAVQDASDPWGLKEHIGAVVAFAGLAGALFWQTIKALWASNAKGRNAQEAAQDERASTLAKSETDKAAALAQSNAEKATALARVLDQRFGDLVTQLTNVAGIIEKSSASFDSRFERLQDITTANVTAVAVLVERARRQDAESDKSSVRTRRN